MEKIEVYKLTKEWIETKNGQIIEKVKSIFFKYECDAKRVCGVLRRFNESLSDKKNPCYFIGKEEISEEILANLMKAGRYFKSYKEYENYCLANAGNKSAYNTIEDSMCESF